MKKRRISAVLLKFWFKVETIPFKVELFLKFMNKIQPFFCLFGSFYVLLIEEITASFQLIFSCPTK